MRNWHVVSMVVSIVLCSCGGAQQGTGPEPKNAIKVAKPAIPLDKVKKARVFVDGAGMKMTLLDLEEQQAIIYITGFKGEMEGKAFRYTGERSGRRFIYCMTHHGRPRCTLHRDSYHSKGVWRAFVAGGPRRGIRVTFDEEKSKAVDVAAILKLHHKQTQSGELAAQQRFDRKAEEAKVMAVLAKRGELLSKACGGGRLAVDVKWSSISDKVLMKYSIAGYCRKVLSEMRGLCGRHEAPRAVFKEIDSVSCEVGDPWGLQRKGNALQFTIGLKEGNLGQKLRKRLLEFKGRDDMTLAQLNTMAQIDACHTAGERKVVLVAPRRSPHPGVSYGDGKTFFNAGIRNGASNNWFYDPRQYNPQNNANFRGNDMRLFSRVEVNREKGTCEVVCGARRIKLELTPRKRVEKILAKATYQPPPFQREPYALARNHRGIYYLVDRGTAEGGKQDFHVYIGPRGRLKRQQMKDIVSDSEGQIFATTNGKLRLVIGKSRAWWIKSKRESKLLWLPIKENLRMIFNDLGVYLTARLGVPCDDL